MVMVIGYCRPNTAYSFVKEWPVHLLGLGLYYVTD